jgi:hypothetical protein
VLRQIRVYTGGVNQLAGVFLGIERTQELYGISFGGCLRTTLVAVARGISEEQIVDTVTFRREHDPPSFLKGER